MRITKIVVPAASTNTFMSKPRPTVGVGRPKSAATAATMEPAQTLKRGRTRARDDVIVIEESDSSRSSDDDDNDSDRPLRHCLKGTQKRPPPLSKPFEGMAFKKRRKSTGEQANEAPMPAPASSPEAPAPTSSRDASGSGPLPAAEHGVATASPPLLARVPRPVSPALPVVATPAPAHTSSVPTGPTYTPPRPLVSPHVVSRPPVPSPFMAPTFPPGPAFAPVQPHLSIPAQSSMPNPSPYPAPPSQPDYGHGSTSTANPQFSSPLANRMVDLESQISYLTDVITSLKDRVRSRQDHDPSQIAYRLMHKNEYLTGEIEVLREKLHQLEMRNMQQASSSVLIQGHTINTSIARPQAEFPDFRDYNNRPFPGRRPPFRGPHAQASEQRRKARQDDNSAVPQWRREPQPNYNNFVRRAPRPDERRNDDTQHARKKPRMCDVRPEDRGRDNDGGSAGGGVSGGNNHHPHPHHHHPQRQQPPVHDANALHEKRRIPYDEYKNKKGRSGPECTPSMLNRPLEGDFSSPERAPRPRTPGKDTDIELDFGDSSPGPRELALPPPPPLPAPSAPARPAPSSSAARVAPPSGPVGTSAATSASALGLDTDPKYNAAFMAATNDVTLIVNHWEGSPRKSTV
ncbi:hypothetical protein DFH11DRAFT_1134900 [Phellopilus nigrolimitatus]|nr:hypothetical protein DFH11DRAFT_1134900 [Phellopilus nigrolimitatus]